MTKSVDCFCGTPYYTPLVSLNYDSKFENFLGTLLLQLGETRKSLLTQKHMEESKLRAELADAMLSTPENELPPELTETISAESEKATTPSEKAPDWEVNLEQILASVLTEPALVEFFEKKWDLAELIRRYKNQRFQRSDSMMAMSALAAPLKV